MKSKCKSVCIVLGMLVFMVSAIPAVCEVAERTKRAIITNGDAVESSSPQTQTNNDGRARSIIPAPQQDALKAVPEKEKRSRRLPGEVQMNPLSSETANWVIDPLTITTLTVVGSLTNNSVLAAAKGASVVFLGAGEQSLSGITSLSTLRICHGNATLFDPLVVTDTLALVSSSLVAASPNGVTVNNTAPGAITIPTDGGSINGTITRAIAAGAPGLYQFTDDSTYLFLNGSLAAPLNVTVTSFPNTFPSAGNTSGAIKRYYTITPGGELTADKVSLAWNRVTENPYNVSVMELILYRNSSGTYWHPEGGVPSTFNQGTCHNVWVGPINQWSNWAIGSLNAPLPVQLLSFTGREIQGRGVRLEWTTASEMNNYGFFIQRKRMQDSLFAELPNVFIAGHGTTSQPQSYSFFDSLVSSGNWQYRLRQVDMSGAEFFSDAVTVGVLTGTRESAPLVFALHQNYPNPFNPATTIKFTVEKTDRATLDVYNIIGQHVARLYDETAEAGVYHTVRFDATNLASGTYICRLQSGGKSQVRKFLLLR